jgi:aryl-alcohol dehydrogenase-like predicted oxidoreductase
LPEARRTESLSRKALWVLASTPGVTAVLNGMRSPEYVGDSMGILQWDALSEVRSLYDTMSKVGK